MLMIDHHQIYIKDFQDLLIMEENFFRISMKDYVLNIRGHDFLLNYYDQNEIRINGHVKVIEYDENRV